MADLRVKSAFAGSLWKIEMAVGDSVAEEDPLIILESKMETPLLAPRAGIVKESLSPKAMSRWCSASRSQC